MAVLAGKSLTERMSETEERIRHLQARKQVLSQQIKQQERKERTRRLIQIGGIVVRLGVDTLEKAQALQREVERRPQVRDWLRKVTERAQEQDARSETE
ncbi:MAG: conjugal transfer protein TraD [Bacillota bacterium]